MEHDGADGRHDDDGDHDSTQGCLRHTGVNVLGFFFAGGGLGLGGFRVSAPCTLPGRAYPEAP